MSEATETQALLVGPLVIMPDEHLARADGRALMLSGRELCLLTELARREDRIVTREDLYALAWRRPLRPHDRSVDVYLRKLRVKLEAALPEWRFIHTHFGFGYRLAAERHKIDTSDSHVVHRGVGVSDHTDPTRDDKEN